MEFPEFKKYKDSGWRSLIHDTCDNGPNGIERIIKFRIHQQECFNYDLCSKSKFTNYLTCSVEPLKYVQVNSRRCSWFYAYYPHLIYSDIYQIACALTGIPVPNTPNKQPNSFGCFARTKYKYNPTNDLPYT